MQVLHKDNRKTTLLLQVNYDGVSIDALSLEMQGFHVEVSRLTNLGKGRKFSMRRDEALALARAIIDNEQERILLVAAEEKRIEGEIETAKAMLAQGYHGSVVLHLMKESDTYQIIHKAEGEEKVHHFGILPADVLDEVKRMMHDDKLYEPTSAEYERWYDV